VSEISELKHRVLVLEQTVATIVAELRQRKVLPPVPPTPTAKKVRKVKMSPEARAKQRSEFLRQARESRWKKSPSKRPKR
jgi:hypothetical protein